MNSTCINFFIHYIFRYNVYILLRKKHFLSFYMKNITGSIRESAFMTEGNKLNSRNR